MQNAMQEAQPLPDVSGSGGRAGAPAVIPPEPVESKEEIQDSLQTILQGAVNVDWADTADPPEVGKMHASMQS